MRTGVLSFQGDFARHESTLLHAGVNVVGVRTPEQLANIDALIIPGGESTTIGMLCERFGLLREIVDRIDHGMPVFGTCAGAILLAEHIEESDQPRIGGLEMRIRRNAYGRQRESFERNVSLSAEFATEMAVATGESETDSFSGVFIRAPRITDVSDEVEVLARDGDDPVLVRKGHIWASTFHPELTGDSRIHRTFLARAKSMFVTSVD
ncbi:MAG: pyridoxal 5'-phosphate synthase glutaminase subunit PdxT [Spirochaetales bacterium]